MLAVSLNISPTQFDKLLAMYFDDWESQGMVGFDHVTGKRFEKFTLQTAIEDSHFITSWRVLERNGLIVRDSSLKGSHITEKGRKICEAVIIEIETWNRRIAKLRKTKRKTA